MWGIPEAFTRLENSSLVKVQARGLSTRQELSRVSEKRVCGDAVGVMKQMPDESIDLVVASPPSRMARGSPFLGGVLLFGGGGGNRTRVRRPLSRTSPSAAVRRFSCSGVGQQPSRSLSCFDFPISRQAQLLGKSHKMMPKI